MSWEGFNTIKSRNRNHWIILCEISTSKPVNSPWEHRINDILGLLTRIGRKHRLCENPEIITQSQSQLISSSELWMGLQGRQKLFKDKLFSVGHFEKTKKTSMHLSFQHSSEGNWVILIQEMHADVLGRGGRYRNESNWHGLCIRRLWHLDWSGQGFSALLALWIWSFFAGGGELSVNSRMSNSIPGLYPLEASSISQLWEQKPFPDIAKYPLGNENAAAWESTAIEAYYGRLPRGQTI